MTYNLLHSASLCKTIERYSKTIDRYNILLWPIIGNRSDPCILNYVIINQNRNF